MQPCQTDGVAVLLSGILNAVAICQVLPPSDMLPKMDVRVVTISPSTKAIEIREGTVRSLVAVPLGNITAAARVDGGYIIGGVAANGAGQVMAITQLNGSWTLQPTAIMTPSYPIAAAMGSGWLAIWLSDGGVWAAACGAPTELPSWGLFQEVGMASGSELVRYPTATVQVVDHNCIRAHRGGSYLRGFRLQPAGDWAPDRVASSLPRPFLEVRGAARIGEELQLRGAGVQGQIWLEEEAGSLCIPVSEGLSGSGMASVPGAVSQQMCPDKRYRLKGYGCEGIWFYPAAIRGSAWAVSGVRMAEMNANQSVVMQERGSAVFHSLLTFDTAPSTARITTVCLFATSRSPLAPVVECNAKTWLIPDAAVALEQSTRAGLRGYALAAPVPLARDSNMVGAWLHAQLVALDLDGKLLAATGVRSVVVLPDAGSRTAVEEGRSRNAATQVWERRSISALGQFWQGLLRQ